MSSSLDNNSDLFSRLSNLKSWQGIKREMISIFHTPEQAESNELALKLKKIAIEIQNIQYIGDISKLEYDIDQNEYDSEVQKLDKLLELYRFTPKRSSSDWNLQIAVSEEHQKIWTALKQDLRYANNPREQEKAFKYRKALGFAT